MSGRFSWRRTQRPAGLAAVAAAGKPRGYELRLGGKLYATVSHTDRVVYRRREREGQY